MWIQDLQQSDWAVQLLAWMQKVRCIRPYKAIQGYNLKAPEPSLLEACFQVPKPGTWALATGYRCMV